MVQTCDSEGNFMAGPKMGCLNSKSWAVSSLPEVCVCVCVCVVVFVSFLVAFVLFLYFKAIFYHPDSLLVINLALCTSWFNWTLLHRGEESKAIHFFVFWGGGKVVSRAVSLFSRISAVSFQRQPPPRKHVSTITHLWCFMARLSDYSCFSFESLMEILWRWMT